MGEVLTWYGLILLGFVGIGWFICWVFDKE